MTMLNPIKHEAVVAAERLEAEICELAGHLAAATCRFLLLLAEFDRREAWGGWGIRSCAQWLSWKCGISPATAREQVRVARALEELPVTTEAFSSGRLSYSKVRALTRVATSDNEAALVETALVTTAAQLERIVVGMRNATRDDVAERHARRKVTWRHDDDGSFVMSIRLDPEEGAVALAALRAAQSSGSDSSSGSAAGSRSASGTDSDSPSVSGSGKASPQAVDTDNVSTETPSIVKGEPLALPDALTAIFTAYVSGKVRDASDPEAFQVIIHTDAETMAAESHPAPATPPGGSAPQKRPTPRTAPAPEKAPTREGNATRTRTSTSDGDPTLDSNHAPDSHLTPDGNLAPDGNLIPDSGLAPDSGLVPEDDTGAPGGHLDDGPALHPDTARRLACDSTTVTLIHRADGSLLDAGRRTRRIGVRLRRALRTRDQGRCRFPGCQRRAHLHAHHVVHWSRGGPTNLDNLTSLCTAHHWLVHEGGFRMWLTLDGELRFATPAGVPIPAVPVPEAVTGDIQDQHLAVITPDTTVPAWDGTPLDLANAVLAHLQPARPVARVA
ncbi:HNH endonuclease signature motif containing protein [Actinomadura alba]